MADSPGSGLLPCLRPLRRGTERPALLITPGLHGDPTFAAFIARETSPRQPVYGYSAPGLDGREPPVADIGQLAERFVAEALAISAPHGVILVGLCSGGHIALKMSPLLSAAGLAVRHLFLVDTPHKMPPEALRSLAAEQQKVAERRLNLRPELARYFMGGVATLQATVEAVNNAKPVHYDGETTVLASEEWRPLIIDEHLGWNRWLPPGTRVRTVAKTRAELLSDAVPKVAAIIGEVSRRCVEPDTPKPF